MLHGGYGDQSAWHLSDTRSPHVSSALILSGGCCACSGEGTRLASRGIFSVKRSHSKEHRCCSALQHSEKYHRVRSVISTSFINRLKKFAYISQNCIAIDHFSIHFLDNFGHVTHSPRESWFYIRTLTWPLRQLWPQSPMLASFATRLSTDLHGIQMRLMIPSYEQLHYIELGASNSTHSNTRTQHMIGNTLL